jgi:hypothetical protein
MREADGDSEMRNGTPEELRTAIMLEAQGRIRFEVWIDGFVYASPTAGGREAMRIYEAMKATENA